MESDGTTECICVTASENSSGKSLLREFIDIYTGRQRYRYISGRRSGGNRHAANCRRRVFGIRRTVHIYRSGKLFCFHHRCGIVTDECAATIVSCGMTSLFRIGNSPIPRFISSSPLFSILTNPLLHLRHKYAALRLSLLLRQPLRLQSAGIDDNNVIARFPVCMRRRQTIPFSSVAKSPMEKHSPVMRHFREYSLASNMTGSPTETKRFLPILMLNDWSSKPSLFGPASIWYAEFSSELFNEASDVVLATESSVEELSRIRRRNRCSGYGNGLSRGKLFTARSTFYHYRERVRAGG